MYVATCEVSSKGLLTKIDKRLIVTGPFVKLGLSILKFLCKMLKVFIVVL